MAKSDNNLHILALLLQHGSPCAKMDAEMELLKMVGLLEEEEPGAPGVKPEPEDAPAPVV